MEDAKEMLQCKCWVVLEDGISKLFDFHQKQMAFNEKTNIYRSYM